MATNNAANYSPTQYTVQVGGVNGSLTSLTTGTAGQILQSGGAGANPAYSTATYPSTAGTSGKILISNGTDIVSSTPVFPNAATQGDILIASAASTWTQLAKSISSTRYLSNTGASNNPAWAQVALSTGVSGTLPVANGGTNATSFTQSNGIVAFDGTRLVNYAGPQLATTGVYTNASQTFAQTYINTSLTNVTGDGTVYPVVFAVEESDVGSGYNNSTGVFTAPTAGVYTWNVMITLDGLGAAHTQCQILTVAGSATWTTANTSTARDVNNRVSLMQSFTAYFTASQTMTVSVYVAGGTKTVGITGVSVQRYSYFSIFKVA